MDVKIPWFLYILKYSLHPLSHTSRMLRKRNPKWNKKQIPQGNGRRQKVDGVRDFSKDFVPGYQPILNLVFETQTSNKKTELLPLSVDNIFQCCS